MNIKIDYLTPSISGRKISCYINEKFIEEAVVVFDMGRFFILQDYIVGNVPRDHIRNAYPYKKSWGVGDGSQKALKANDVKGIVLLSEKGGDWGYPGETPKPLDTSNDTREKPIKLLTQNKFLKINQDE